MLSSRPPRIALPPSTIAIKPQDDETTPNLPKLRIQVLPKGLVVNSPPASPRPDTRAIANALKVLVPFNGSVHIKISLDLFGLSDHQTLRLREEALHVLDGCLRDVLLPSLASSPLTQQNAGRLGLERITRCPEPRISVSEEDDVDLHYQVLPKAALPEHDWFKEQALAYQEPYIQLEEIHIRMSWSKIPNGVPKGGAAIDCSGSYLDAVHHQLRRGMRRVLRLQFIQRFPLVFDDSFIQRYKDTLKPPAALIYSLRSFLSLAVQHDTPLLGAARDLLDDIEENQDMTLRRQVQATVKVAPKRGPKKRKVDEGSISDPDDDSHMDAVAIHLRRLGRREDTFAESSISRALIAIGVSEWSCVRRGQSKAGAGRIALENTPVPNTPHPYDDIRNRTRTSRVPSPLHDNKYIPALNPAYTFSSSCQTYQHQHQPSEQIESGMYEPQLHINPFSTLPPLRPVSRASVPPPTPRPKCVELPLLDDDLDFEYDSPEAECASSMGHIYLDDWSTSLSSPDETDELSADLSAVEIETFSTTNALWLDLLTESRTFAFGRASDEFSDAGDDPTPPRAAVPVSSSIAPSTPTLATPLEDCELSDDLTHVMLDFDAPESSRRRRSRSTVPRVASGPDIGVTNKRGDNQTFMSPPDMPGPIQRSFSDGHSTDAWVSDWDVDMPSAPFEDDLGVESDATERDELSPPSLDEDSDLESDGPSIDSPQESGVLMSGVDLRSKSQGSEPSQFAQFVDDLDFDDEVLVTPMEEDAPFSLPVA